MSLELGVVIVKVAHVKSAASPGHSHQFIRFTSPFGIMSNEIAELKQVIAQLQKQVGRLSGTA